VRLTGVVLAASSATDAGAGASGWVAPTIVIAIVALAVSLATFLLSGRRARLDRQRQVFADAFSAVAEYREYPFIVRRRDPAGPAQERKRISSDLSQVQARLNGFSARLRVEDPYVGARYADLVAATRRVAGKFIREAWNSEAVAVDAQIHSPAWDMSELDAYEDAYLVAVADHLAWLHAPLRRKARGWRRGRSAAVERRQSGST
jgi:hypothetical protein